MEKKIRAGNEDAFNSSGAKTLLHQQDLGEEHNRLLSQLNHVLDSPESLQAFVDGLETWRAPWLPRKSGKGWKKAKQQIKEFLKAFPSLYFQPSEDPHNFLKVFLQSFSMIILRDLLKNAAFPLVTVRSPEITDHYPHRSVPDHAPRIVDEGKFKDKEGAQLSDRLITLKEAAGLYPDEVSYGNVLRWHYSGRLEERRWLARPGGRSIPLVSQAELAYLKDHRPPVGKQISKHRRPRSRTNQ
jgi:hypothetical protein